MLTECPSCLTVFRVTGAILKIGHGQVRCGKCRTQFDALDSLLDEEDAPEEAQAARDAESSTPAEQPSADDAIEVRPPDVAEEIIMEGSRIEISGTYRVANDNTAGSGDAQQVFHEHVVIDREQRSDESEPQSETDQSVEEIVLQSDDGEPVADAARHLWDERVAVADSSASKEPSSLLPLSQRIWQRARAKAHRNAEHREIAAELDALTLNETPPLERRNWWIAASAVLIVTLIAQWVHHHRDPLVRHPKWGDTISRVYRALGLNLTPNWDLRAYELQVWDVRIDANAKDTLRVRASVTNSATFAQPLPLIKLALEDRWGMPVAQRTFTPEEYLPSTTTADRMMAPRQRANAEVAIVDPGADAVGFQSHPCLMHDAGIVCSDDAPFVK